MGLPENQGLYGSHCKFTKKGDNQCTRIVAFTAGDETYEKGARVLESGAFFVLLVHYVINVSLKNICVYDACDGYKSSIPY